MPLVYAVKEMEDGTLRGKTLNEELLDIFSEPLFSSDNKFGNGPLIDEDDTYYGDTIKEFIEKHRPKAFYLNGDFYKMIEKGVYVEFNSVRDYNESSIETDFGFADEEKLSETDIKVIDIR